MKLHQFPVPGKGRDTSGQSGEEVRDKRLKC